MICATAYFRFADLGFALDFDFDLLDPLPALSWPDLLRLPSTERPPASIMAA
jgi:hypothetical protein